ncbi:MAG: hypothetical protein Q9228_006450, partial [Teloschistes exilis]
LQLTPRPPKPTFTAQKLSALPDLREAMRAWVDEFRDEAPFAEDVEALVKYVQRVVKEEKDMGKAVGVVRWLVWLVGEAGGAVGRYWAGAMARIEAGVQEAVRERGLGEVVI